jgi:hypothetical protein
MTPDLRLMDLGKLEKTGQNWTKLEKARTQIPPSEAFSAHPMRGKEISTFWGKLRLNKVSDRKRKQVNGCSQ